jgi:DNA-binding CsgD family transcriptional regulator
MAPGHPRHPDILTPRQWEVLGLIRKGLTDPAIAERLQISLDGAKYHVSEILARLGVSTREQAAAWEPPEQPPTGHRSGLLLQIPLVVAAIGTLAGVTLLAVAVFTNDTRGPTSDLSVEATSIQTPTSTPTRTLIIGCMMTSPPVNVEHVVYPRCSRAISSP